MVKLLRIYGNIVMPPENGGSLSRYKSVFRAGIETGSAKRSLSVLPAGTKPAGMIAVLSYRSHAA